MNMKTILVAALVALFTCAASEAKADTVWTLSNVELSDGTYLNGSIDINVNGYLDKWNLTTTATVGGLNGYTYTNNPDPVGPSINNPTDTVVTFHPGTYEGYLTLTFQNSLNIAAATDSIVSGSECYGWSCPSSAQIRYVDANQSAQLAAPLPAAMWMVGSALAGLLGFGVRRRVPA